MRRHILQILRPNSLKRFRLPLAISSSLRIQDRDPVPLTESAFTQKVVRIVLFRNSLELARRVNEVVADLISKLDYRDKIAYTKTEAHRDVKHDSGISTLDSRL
jgi:hypothetical protein